MRCFQKCKEKEGPLLLFDIVDVASIEKGKKTAFDFGEKGVSKGKIYYGGKLNGEPL